MDGVTDLNSRLHQARLVLDTLALMLDGPPVVQLPAVPDPGNVMADKAKRLERYAE